MKKILIVIAAIFIFLVILILNRSSLNNFITKLGVYPKPKAVPTASPYHVILPQGRQVYNISQGGKSIGPNIRQVIVDPFDPKIGQVQNYLVKIENPIAVKSATVILYNDKETVSQALKLIEGDAKSGVWAGSTTILNTHYSLYRLHVIATDGKDSSKVELSFI